MRTELLRLEARLVGLAAYAAPPLILIAFAALGVIARREGNMVVAGLETAVPLATGIAAASMVSQEPSLELQLGMPGGYRPAALRRLAILFAWSSLVSLAGWAVGNAAGLVPVWGPIGGPVAAQLTWLAPLAFFIAAGALAAIVLRARATAIGLLAFLWVAGHIFHGAVASVPWLHAWVPFLTTYAPDDPQWLPTRLALVAVAGVAVAGLTLSLRAGEWLLASEDA